MTLKEYRNDIVTLMNDHNNELPCYNMEPLIFVNYNKDNYETLKELGN